MTALEEVAAELYGLDLDQFTATRNLRAREVRAAGDRGTAERIASLRRPTAAAWAVNRLVRAHPAEVEQLLELGDALRDAQEALAGDELRELNRRQHGVLAAIRRQAKAVAAQAGHTLSDSVGRQVEATLRAAMADPAAAAAVRSGALTTDLESTGFGPVDVDDAVGDVVLLTSRPAGTRTPGPVEKDSPVEKDRPAEKFRPAERTVDEERLTEERRAEELRAEQRRQAERARREVQAARREVEQAERAAETAAVELERAERRVTELARSRDELAGRIEELTRALAEAQDVHGTADREHRAARDERAAARRADRDASRVADRARAHLERLR